MLFLKGIKKFEKTNFFFLQCLRIFGREGKVRTRKKDLHFSLKGKLKYTSIGDSM